MFVEVIYFSIHYSIKRVSWRLPFFLLLLFILHYFSSYHSQFKVFIFYIFNYYKK
nr:MAG TPA: hypothetical protein [Caudoviricetes sp.]